MFELIKTYKVKNSTGYVYILNGKRAATFAKSLNALKLQLGVSEQRQWIATMAAAAQVVELPTTVTRELVISAIEEIAALDLQGPDWARLDRAPRNCMGITDATSWSEFKRQIIGMAYWSSRFADDFYLSGVNDIMFLTA